MANSKKLSIIIGAIDKLSGPMARISRTIEKVRGPVDRTNRAMSKLGRASGLKQFNRSLRKAATSAKKTARAVKGIGKIVGGFALLAGGAVAGLAKSFANSGDNVAKTADRLGIGIEALQKYRYAAERSGVSSETFDMALQRMGRRAAEAGAGMGAARDALKTLNVEVKDSGGNMRSTEQILLDSLDALGRVQDPLIRNALAMKLFDSEGVKLVQMTKDGAEGIKKLGDEAVKLGLIMSEKAARDSEKFNDSLTNLGGSLTGLRNRIGEKLIPVLLPLIEKLTTLAVDVGPAVAQWADKFAKNLPEHLATLREGFNDLLANLQPIIRAGKWISENFGLMNTAFAVIGTLIAGSLVSALSSLVTVFWALGAAILGTPIGWIIGGIAALVGAGVLLYKNWDKVKEVFASMAKSIIQNNPFTLMTKGVNALIESLTGFDILGSISAKLNNLLPSWAIDLLGLESSSAALKSPIVGSNTTRSELHIKIDSEGRARIQDLRTDANNTTLSVDAGRAMQSSGHADTYSRGYAQFGIGG